VCKERELGERRKEKMIEMCEQFGLQREQRLSTFVSQVKGAQEAFEQTKDMIERLQAWARQREDGTSRKDLSPMPSEWLVLLGPVGTGKTHLAMAMANGCIDAGITTLFAARPALLDHLRASYAPEAPVVSQQWLTQMSQVEVLVLDDMGMQHHSNWADEKVFQLIDTRYTARLPTVITLTREAWTSLDERIRSRLQHVGLLVSLEQAQDYRVRGRKEQRNAAAQENEG
jgi:DNA replication protein DnaC